VPVWLFIRDVWGLSAIYAPPIFFTPQYNREKREPGVCHSVYALVHVAKKNRAKQDTRASVWHHFYFT
jgi:hypothetical protein